MHKDMRKQKTVQLDRTQIYLAIILNIPLRFVNEKIRKSYIFKKG